MGDFNSILGPHEKQGGRRSTALTVHNELQDFLTCTDLTDLGFVGNPYTWRNNKRPPHRILERLDRCLDNCTWLNAFGQLVVHHLPCIGSDHFSILLATTNKPRIRQTFFRFENMWTVHPAFKDTVRQAWDHASENHIHLNDKLVALKGDLLEKL